MKHMTGTKAKSEKKKIKKKKNIILDWYNSKGTNFLLPVVSIAKLNN
jgi:hypothetical protein